MASRASVSSTSLAASSAAICSLRAWYSLLLFASRNCSLRFSTPAIRVFSCICLSSTTALRLLVFFCDLGQFGLQFGDVLVKRLGHPRKTIQTSRQVAELLVDVV